MVIQDSSEKELEEPTHREKVNTEEEWSAEMHSASI